jgi:hypothetical protein
MRIPLLSSTSPVNPSRFPQKIPWNFLIPSHVLHPHQDLDAALRPGEDPGEAPRRNSATKTGMITGWLVGFKGVEWNWTQQKMNMIPYWSWGNLDKQWQYHVQLCVYNIYTYIYIYRPIWVAHISKTYPSYKDHSKDISNLLWSSIPMGISPKRPGLEWKWRSPLPQ